MKSLVLLLAASFLVVACAGCGGSPQNTCNITAIVTPLSAISDHNVPPPNNQVQFVTASSVSGNCPLIADTLGTWSTSAPGNTSIDSNGLATCLGATTTPATISNSGTVPILFYSHEPNEPPHVHVDRDDLSAKFWLDPVALAQNFGFNARELGVLYGIIVEHQQQLLEAWHGYFGARRG